MSLEDWMMSLPPFMGGKRPRSPVEKLADLQGQAEAEDEDNWRNSKRYLSEVIANGFSRLNFGLQRPYSSEQQQQLGPQVLSLTSPRTSGGPGGCYIQLPGGMLSPRDGGDWDMDMESPPGCPGSGSSAGNAAGAAAATTCQRTSRSPSGRGNRPNIVTEALAGQHGSPMCSPAGGSSGNSPVQYPFSSYASPGAKPLPPPAWQIASGAAGAAAGTTVAAGPVGAAPAVGMASPAVPKALKAAEKAPNSPSDLPAAGSNLRKVALLRSLLARTEQHLQQQQQQQLQPGQLTLEQQQPGQQQHHEQQAHAVHHQVPSSLQQQQQYGPDLPSALQHGGTSSAAGVRTAGTQEGPTLLGVHRQAEHRGLAATAVSMPAAGTAAGASNSAAPVHHQAACSTHSDDMECSSSSMCDSDSETHQQRSRPAAVASDADLATSSLLCTEVLPLSSTEMLSIHHQQRQQLLQQHGAWPQHDLAALKQQQQQAYTSGCAPQQFGPQLQSQMGQHNTWAGQQQHMVQQTQQQQQMRQQLLQPPEQHQQEQHMRSLELTAERLQQLRAKALASTSRLTELEPEDLASLQLSISASQARRGSADHNPSHLHSARAAAEARRHSSHI